MVMSRPLNRRTALGSLAALLLGFGYFHGQMMAQIDAPIVRQAILRYALSCPKTDPAAATFVAERRKQDPELVKDAEDALRFLKQK